MYVFKSSKPRVFANIVRSITTQKRRKELQHKNASKKYKFHFCNHRRFRSSQRQKTTSTYLYQIICRPNRSDVCDHTEGFDTVM